MAIQLFKELIDGNGHLEIPEGVRKILPNTLMNCESLTSVSIPGSVTIIGACSFLGCRNLRQVELREGLRTIDVAAFMGCTSLESIIIPEGVRIIAHDAFKGCTGLSRIVLPSSVSIIGRGAFEGCTSLTEDDLNLISPTARCFARRITGRKGIDSMKHDKRKIVENFKVVGECVLTILAFPPVLFVVLFSIALGLKRLFPDWYDEHNALSTLTFCLVFFICQSFLAYRVWGRGDKDDKDNKRGSR